MKITTNVPLDSPWYGKFWPTSSPKQLEYDDSETMYDLLVRNAKEIPDYPVMWFLDTWVNYKQLKEMVDKVATGFSNLGFKKGDVLGVILPNSIQFVVTYYAAFKLGIIVTPVNPTYKLAEVRHQLNLTKAKYIFVLDALYPHLVEPIEEELGIEKVIVTNLVDMATGMSTIKRWLGKILKKIPSAKVPGAIQFSSLLKFPPNTPRAEINALEDTSVLLMTGGTTGIPKAAKLSFSNLCANAIQSVGALAKQRENEDSPIIGPKTGNICVLPLFHSFALTAIMNFAIASKGWIVLFPKPPATKEFCETMEKLPDYNGYIYCAAEVLFQRLIDFEDLEKYDIISKLRFSVSGAGPLHKKVEKTFERRTSAHITEGYGLTEASPIVSVGTFFGEERCTGTVGLPFPGTEWKIFDSENFEKGPLNGTGEENTGEICICGPQVMLGYLNEPKRTAETIRNFDGKRWLLTGDIGYIDDFGRVVIRDRKKQLIKSRGHSIFPAEIENLVGQHPDVLDVACAGVPDEDSGEHVKIWASLKPESKLTEEELLIWCKNNMSGYKIPREIEFRAQIPKSMVGKVMRRQLQEEHNQNLKK